MLVCNPSQVLGQYNEFIALLFSRVNCSDWLISFKKVYGHEHTLHHVMKFLSPHYTAEDYKRKNDSKSEALRINISIKYRNINSFEKAVSIKITFMDSPIAICVVVIRVNRLEKMYFKSALLSQRAKVQYRANHHRQYTHKTVQT